MRPGQRVFWHGIFPDPKRTGVIKQTGTMRHEVLWDGAETTSMENLDALMPVTRFGKCCAYCASKQQQAEIQQLAGELINKAVKLADDGEATQPHSVVVIDPETGAIDTYGPYPDRAAAGEAKVVIETRLLAGDPEFANFVYRLATHYGPEEMH